MRVGKGRCDKRLAQRKLSSNQRSENRHLAEWRFSPLIRIVTVYPKICSVIVIGISTTSSRRCDQPPAVRATPDRILPSSAYSVKKPALLYESATLLYEGILPAANRKRGSCFDPHYDPRAEKSGRKQWSKAHLRVRKSRGKSALFSQNPAEDVPIESSHA